MIQYQFYPRSIAVMPEIVDIIKAFQSVQNEIDSEQFSLKSNAVLARVRPGLEQLQFSVEKGKKRNDKIDIPVLYGKNNKIVKRFSPDAISKDKAIVIEVEAGRATENNQVLKDIFEACLMDGVDYLVLAVRNIYRDHEDFNKVSVFLDALYSSNRMHLPLKGILLIGY